MSGKSLDLSHASVDDGCHVATGVGAGIEVGMFGVDVLLIVPVL